jgi:hypothetical protein
MYYSYVEIEYIATSFSPARTDIALKLLRSELSRVEEGEQTHVCTSPKNARNEDLTGTRV